ncbi:MAG: dihydroorotase [Bacillota bacterium]|nr:dihydroorotase [Bacillota bacterium]
MKLLIKNGFVIDKSGDLFGKYNILIEDDKIFDITPDDISEEIATEVIDAEGLIVAPGLVDMHCHLREPGFERKETIATGSRSAAAGGFTTIACMPNTNPVIDNKTVVEYVLSQAKTNAVIDVYPIGAITKNLEGKCLASIGEMKFAGIVAISDDGRPVMDSNIMKNAMVYAASFDTPVISHCEDTNLVCGGVMNEGYYSTIMGLRGIPASAEEAMIARDLVLARSLNIPIHIAHVSTRNGIQIIREAKAAGVLVTCETCPHYFSLTHEAVLGYNTAAKVNPPLRSSDDVAAVIEGLCDGTIDVIATDHAPHDPESKNCEFDRAASGMVGFETALSLGITNLVKTGKMELSDLLYKMTAKPADILRLNKGRLCEDGAADIVIFSEDEKRTVKAEKLQSKSKNTPFDGKELYGAVKYTICGGKVVVSQGELA